MLFFQRCRDAETTCRAEAILQLLNYIGQEPGGIALYCTVQRPISPPSRPEDHLDLDEECSVRLMDHGTVEIVTRSMLTRIKDHQLLDVSSFCFPIRNSPLEILNVDLDMLDMETMNVALESLVQVLVCYLLLMFWDL